MENAECVRPAESGDEKERKLSLNAEPQRAQRLEGEKRVLCASTSGAGTTHATWRGFLAPLAADRLVVRLRN